MAYQITHSLAQLEVLKSDPLSVQITQDIASHRETIKRVLSGEDQRKLVICGPCSIHSRDSAVSYAERLKVLADEVADSLFLVMRNYFEKPRTQYAWKGFLHQPSVTGEVDLISGIKQAREILVEVAHIGIPAGTEVLSPSLISYFEDLISWACIGARTSESQTHREIASSLEVPVGFKNTTEGNTGVAINGMISASQPHQLIRIIDGVPYAVISGGNPDTHLVLRGRNYPQYGSNYDATDIIQAVEQLDSYRLKPKILVDCSHGNCAGDFKRQVDVAHIVLEHIQQGLPVQGILLESHIRGGRGSIQTPLPSDLSITDPCLGWEDTERLVRSWAEALA